MARKLRIEYEGAIYHVINRGDRREPIFRDDSDRELFLQTLAQACEKTGWLVLAWCLMSNHFHLVLETPKPNLVAGMKWFLGTYTGRFNRKHKLFGHLFSGRYKALLVDGSGDGYLRTVCEYVHLNPSRAKLLTDEQKLTTYRWSSHGEYLKKPHKRVPWLRVNRLFGEMAIPKDSPAGRAEYERRIELLRHDERPETWKQVRRGWFLGDKAFKQELLDRMDQRTDGSHYGEELRESDEQKAERIVTEEIKKLKWQEADLTTRRKSDPGKIKIAKRLRQETTMTLKWVAKRLSMGAWTHVSNLMAKGKQ